MSVPEATRNGNAWAELLQGGFQGMNALLAMKPGSRATEPAPIGGGRCWAAKPGAGHEQSIASTLSFYSADAQTASAHRLPRRFCCGSINFVPLLQQMLYFDFATISTSISNMHEKCSSTATLQTALRNPEISRVTLTFPQRYPAISSGLRCSSRVGCKCDGLRNPFQPLPSVLFSRAQESHPIS